MSTEVVMSDLRFKQGQKSFAEGKYEAAAEFFSDVLQSSSNTYGDTSIEVAPLWYEYGNALLSKEEDSPTDDLLGAAADEAKKQAQILGEELRQQNDEDDENDEDEEEDQEANKTSADGAAEEEEASDMEIAWEALEMARSIYEKNPGADTDKRLSE
eukprot:gene54217-72456_t